MENRFPALFFSLSVIGLLLIYVSAGKTEAKTVGISGIDASMVGFYVETTGYVESADFAESKISVKLSDGYETVNVVVFSDLRAALGDTGALFSEGSVISVRGVVDEYKGVIEIIPNRVSDIRRLGR
ncbi:MAG: hypothetical protein HY516_02385 [Candidatus Aenigmarchaeota archaeon]|nr:hypothetical protein [Candidatus Aenigmarchaeota archaeon]